MFDLVTAGTQYLVESTLYQSLLLDALSALIVHKIYNKHEVDPANFLPTLLLLVVVPATSSYLLSGHLGSIPLSILISYALFYSVLILSIILYRISPLHPLAKYPGPFMLRISKFATMYYAKDGKQYLSFKALHDKYGPYVRVGPNELSIVEVEAIPFILGQNGMRKGPLMAFHQRRGTKPHLLAVRDVNEHAERRKLWNHAFTIASLKELQPAVENRVLQLTEAFSKRVTDIGGRKAVIVDMTEWMAYFTYDIMGDMVFGGGFELMRDGDRNGVRTILDEGMKMIGILEHIPWINNLVETFDAEPEPVKELHRWGAQRYDMRKQRGSAKRDLFHYFTNEEGKGNIEVSRDQGINDMFAAIIAGADTTCTVLSGVFFYLLSNPPSLERLQSEVDSVFPPGEGEPFDAAKLSNMDYLNAVIYETLRLQPPLPTSLQRSPLEKSGGKWVAGRFIPESVAVYVPPYVLHRDERYFSPAPNEFIPDRWLNEPRKRVVTTIAPAFIPFSAGPANCAGRNLALLEMRMVVASLVQKFEMRIAQGYDPRTWEEDLRDYFVFKVGRLPVTLIQRT